MKIIPEIDVSLELHQAIKQLRNASFPDHQTEQSYFKQLPHLRVVEYQGDRLIGYLGLDFRVISVDGKPFKVLGVIDFCIAEHARGQGIGTSMLVGVEEFARTKDVDFIILISDLDAFYRNNGFTRIMATQSWLRVHEHRNYGVAVEPLDELYVKPVGDNKWPPGHVDWLGYMF